jgi:hypothetical protein
MSGRGDLVVEVMNGRESVRQARREEARARAPDHGPTARQELIAQKVEERRKLQTELDAFRMLEAQAKGMGYRF